MKKCMMFLVVVGFVFLFLPSARAGTAFISFDPSLDEASGNVAGYKVYVGLTYSSVANTEVAPIYIGLRHSYCISVPDNVLGLFVTVTAFNSVGLESVTSNIAYHLRGNMKGDMYDGTPYNAARVDGQDLAIIGQYWGQTVTQQSFNCNAEFVVQIPTLQQKADANRDGRIDGRDLSILGQTWGKILSP